MGLSRYISRTTKMDQTVTQSRQHVAPHALGPGLLHAAEEAAHHSRPGQASAVVAYILEFLFSDIPQHVRSSSGFMGSQTAASFGSFAAVQ
jgi:hypothetical protein